MKKSHLHSQSGRVIITYGRSLMALTAAHTLGRRGIQVIGCDDVDMTVMNFSKYVSDYFLHAPYRDDVEQYLDDLEENIIKFRPDDDRPYILMPMFRDAKLLARHHARFEPYIKIAAPDYRSISKIHPKDALANTCEKYDLNSPKTWQPKTLQALADIRREFAFPVLIKPADDIGGRGIHKVGDYNTLEEVFEKSLAEYGRPPLIQQMIEGEDYCLAAICDQGQIVAHMAYKNLHQFPRGSGAGIMRETIDDTPFIDTAQTLLKALNWHGVAQIDFRWSGQEHDLPYLIEINPRFWAGLFHSVESGVDFPWLLYQLTAHGKITDTGKVKIGEKTKVPGLWAFSALQDIAECETHFDELQKTWHETWDANNDKSWREKFKNLGAALQGTIDGGDILAKIKAMHEAGKDAKSEFSFEDDPFTRLGFLFVASSLLRHGELPPELKT